MQNSVLMGQVDLSGLKRWALRLPPGHPLRTCLEVEDDSLPPAEFLAKVGLWLKLLESSG